jgi:hypothetical protein
VVTNLHEFTHFIASRYVAMLGHPDGAMCTEYRALVTDLTVVTICSGVMQCPRPNETRLFSLSTQLTTPD